MYIICVILTSVYAVFMADKVSATRNLYPFLGIFIDESNAEKKMKDIERYRAIHVIYKQYIRFKWLQMVVSPAIFSSKYLHTSPTKCVHK